jgi:hypothetical protein
VEHTSRRLVSSPHAPCQKTLRMYNLSKLPCWRKPEFDECT